MQAETREYLNGPWEAHHDAQESIICGPDGDAVLVCRVHNAAHLMRPRDVAEYLLELKAFAVAGQPGSRPGGDEGGPVVRQLTEVTNG